MIISSISSNYNNVSKTASVNNPNKTKSVGAGSDDPPITRTTVNDPKLGEITWISYPIYIDTDGDGYGDNEKVANHIEKVGQKTFAHIEGKGVVFNSPENFQITDVGQAPNPELIDISNLPLDPIVQK